MQKFPPIVSMLSLLLGLFFATPANAIIRRHDVDDSQYVIDASDYPALVDLLAPGDCIATLIAPRWLITAAHCAEHLRADATLVIANTNYTVSSTKIPTSWNDDTDDVALVELSDAVPNVAPIPIYRGTDEVGQLIWFVGRGDTNTGLNGQSGARPDGLTRKASNRIVDADAWWVQFVFNSPDDAEVTDLEGISGDGDSGGPALLETSEGTWIVGLSSYQDEGRYSLGTYGVREFYTRVSQYTDWIDGFIPTDEQNENTDTSDSQQESTTDDGSTSPSTDAESGCSCSTTAAPWSQALGWLVIIGMVVRRRRAFS